MNKSAIVLPDALKGKYELTRPIFGGPVFDFPAQGLKGVDLTQLTERQADTLEKRGWAGIRKVVQVSATKAIAPEVKS